jgi:hypothetical protein
VDLSAGSRIYGRSPKLNHALGQPPIADAQWGAGSEEAMVEKQPNPEIFKFPGFPPFRPAQSLHRKKSVKISKENQ